MVVPKTRKTANQFIYNALAANFTFTFADLECGKLVSFDKPATAYFS